MQSSKITFSLISIILIAVILIGGLGWANYRFVKTFSVAWRFDVHWQAVRLFARQGLSPYSEETNSTIRTVFQDQEAFLNSSQSQYTSPLYSAFIIFPLALIGKPLLAKTIWLVILELSLFVIGIQTCRLTGWKPGRFHFFAFLLFAIFSYPSIQAVLSGDTIILAGLFMTLGLTTLQNRRLELAGILFALATIQPGMILLPFLFVIVWSLSRRTWQLVTWLLGSIIVLSIVGVFFVPDWPLQYLREIWKLRDYTDILTSFHVLNRWIPGMGQRIGIGLAIFSGVTLIVEWVLARNKDFKWFLWVFYLTFVLSPWTGIPTSLQNFFLFILPAGLVLSVWDQRLGKAGPVLSFLILIILFPGFWLVFSGLLTQTGADKCTAALFFFGTGIFLLLLYWVRWWVIRPSSSLYEDLRSSVE